MLNTHYRYVSERARDPADQRDALDRYHRVDLSTNVSNFLHPGTTLSVGVNNVFDVDIRYPAIMGGYPEDFPQRGLEWWMQVSYAF